MFLKFMIILGCFVCWSVRAMDIIVSDGSHAKTHLLIQSEQCHPAEHMLVEKLKASLALLGTIAINTTQEQHMTLESLRKKNIDYLLVLNVYPNSILAKMYSPWSVALQTEFHDWPVLFEKSFSFQNIEQMYKIANQLVDDLMFHIFYQPGFASYPLFYVEHKNTYNIVTSDLQGDLKKVLHTTDHPIISMACSADATKIAFVELTPQGSALVVIDRKTKNKKTIVNQYYVSSPVFSEDGQTIYYIAAPYGTTHIYRHDLSLDQPERLTSAQDWIVDLSPGIEPYTLLITADRTAASQLYEFNVLNKRFKRITFTKDNCSKGVMSSRQKVMLYTITDENQTILVSKEMTQPQEDVLRTVSKNYAESATFSPTAGLIAFERTVLGKRQIVLKDLKSGYEHLLSAHTEVLCPCWAAMPGFD